MRFFLCFIFLFSISLTNAQNLTDVVRYSVVDFGATGRAIGAGGSFSAMGADFSLVGSNPAGLAAFRRSELVITPGFDLVNNTANLANDVSTLTDDSRKKLNLTNFGVVLSSYRANRKWKTFNIGLGVNRIANFHKNISYRGATNGSISDRWLELSQGFTVEEVEQDPFETGLAWDSGILLSTGDRSYTTDYQDATNSPLLDKSQTVQQKGYISEFGISLATNYNDKLYAGVMLGFPILFFEEEKAYREEDQGGNVEFFDAVEFNENLSTAGAGVNFKLGTIYRLNQMLRFGLAVHTSTVYTLEEDFSTSLNYRFTDPDFEEGGLQESPAGNFNYTLRTPWRLSASVGSIITKRGFVSAEVEYVDYANSQFNFTSDAGGDISRQNTLNEEINSTLNSATNLRLGGEWTYKIYRFRAGANFFGAVSDDVESKLTYHAGLGLRKNSFFMDLAYKLDNTENSFYAYRTQLSSSQIVQNDTNRNAFILTFGFKI